MFVVSSLAVLLVGQVTTAPPTSAPVLQVGVFSYGPDGKEQAAAYATTLDSESLQYIAGCEIGGGNRPVPDRATDAWRVSGKVETLSAEEAVVRIDWQRVRAARAGTTSPGGSVQLTLHPGDRVPLDSANPDATAACGARTIGFEARFAPRPGFMAERAPRLFALIIDHLRDVGEARSSREIDDHFSRHLNVNHVTTACEYLADQQLIGKASLPVRLTKKSTIEVQELAFFYLSDPIHR